MVSINPAKLAQWWFNHVQQHGIDSHLESNLTLPLPNSIFYVQAQFCTRTVIKWMAGLAEIGAWSIYHRTNNEDFLWKQSHLAFQCSATLTNKPDLVYGKLLSSSLIHLNLEQKE